MMESWEYPQENHALVKHAVHGSLLVKLTSHTSVSEVLHKVCEHWNLEPGKHTLSYCKEEMRDGDKQLAKCIPPNSTLQITESSTSTHSVDSVTVSLQIDDTVFSKSFNKYESLLNVVNELNNSTISFDENHSGDSGDKIQQNPDEQKQSLKTSSDEQEIKSWLERDKKLLVQLPHGAIEMTSEHMDSTKLADISYNGLLFLSFLDEEVEDASPREQYSGGNNLNNRKELSLIPIDERNDMFRPESQPSVTRIKRIIASGLHKKSVGDNPTIMHRTLNRGELYDRNGMIYTLDEKKSWDTESVETELYDESSLHGIYLQIWVSVCFPNGLALQAEFTPSEYVQDIKDYVKSFLSDSSEEFDLYFKQKILDTKKTLFKCGLPPMVKLQFVISQPNTTDEEQDDSDEFIKSVEKSNQLNGSCIEKNFLDPKFTKKIITESASIGTAIKFKKTDPNIIIESEIYRPKLNVIKEHMVKTSKISNLK